MFTSLAVVGLSLATVFGAFKLKSVWKHIERGWLKDSEARTNLEEEVTALRRSLKESRAEVNEKTTVVLSHEKEIENLRSRILVAESELDGLRAENRVMTNRTATLDTQRRQLEGELQRAKVEYEQTAELLEVRTSELKGAQAFLTKTDQLSGAEVIKLLEGLNGEIMQIAASMTEELAIEEKKIDDEGKEQESDEMREAFARTEDIIGPRMAELLKTSEHHEDPILVQIAVQASMAAYTHWIVSSWVFESPEDEHMLSEIYARVRESEEQAISGRWRQLTRTHLQRMLAHEPDLSSDMMNAIANIFTTAGLKDSPEMVHERISNRFAARIAVVMKLAQGLNKRIGEGITSCDLEALYIAPDVTYNSITMEDAMGLASAGGVGSGRETILCTTDLGLVRAEKIAGAMGDWKESVLLRPKVVLYSGIAGIIGDTEVSL
ncbi:hypothetical protein BDZ97DRAFT_1667372 [Flammula alnicola]|nr:hypothetical protein BDZ97DRAFT_1667372 [Flammula alnicola]